MAQIRSAQKTTSILKGAGKKMFLFISFLESFSKHWAREEEEPSELSMWHSLSHIKKVFREAIRGMGKSEFERASRREREASSSLFAALAWFRPVSVHSFAKKNFASEFVCSNSFFLHYAKTDKLMERKIENNSCSSHSALNTFYYFFSDSLGQWEKISRQSHEEVFILIIKRIN